MAKKMTQLAMFSFIIILLAPIGLYAQDKMQGNRELTADNFQVISDIQWDAGINLLSEKFSTARAVDMKNQTKETVIPVSMAPNSTGFFNRTIPRATYFKFPVVVKVEKDQNFYKNTTKKDQKTDISYFVKDITNESGNKILLALFEEDNQ